MTDTDFGLAQPLWEDLHPPVLDQIRNSVPEYWPELRKILDDLLNGDFLEAFLPLASCQAVNGNPSKAIPVAAAMVTVTICFRILDDLCDQDRSDRLWAQIGQSRSWNLATALQSAAFQILCNASLPQHTINHLAKRLSDSLMCTAAGQDHDLRGCAPDIDAYWTIIDQKIAYGYAAGCELGAYLGTEDESLIQMAHDYGRHLGYTIQILNDLDSIWLPDGLSDLQREAITLPIIYGLNCEHPRQNELQELVHSGQMRIQHQLIQEILEEMRTREFLVWSALQERQRAINAIETFPNSEGRQVLEAFITDMFGDLDTMLPNDNTTKKSQI